MGPLSWLVQMPGAANVVQATTIGGIASGTATVVALITGGTFSGDTPTPPRADTAIVDFVDHTPTTAVLIDIVEPPPDVTPSSPPAAVTPTTDTTRTTSAPTSDTTAVASPAPTAGSASGPRPPLNTSTPIPTTPSPASTTTITTTTTTTATTTTSVPSTTTTTTTTTSVPSTTTTTTTTTPLPLLALDDVLTSSEDTPIVADLGVNDLVPGAVTAAFSAPAHGSLTTGSGTTITYQPDPDWSGTDLIAYTIDDGTGRTSTATATITVTPQPDAPTANDDAYTTGEDTDVLVGLVDNDTDVDGDALAITTATATRGSILLTPATTTYTPPPNWSGTDLITYTVDDGTGRTSTATATITVTPRPDAPTANDDGYTTLAGTPLSLSPNALMANDGDQDGEPLTARLVNGATNGLVVVLPDGTFAYTPTVGYFGNDSFVYEIEDPTGRTDSATVTITVTQGPATQSDLYLEPGSPSSDNWRLATTAPGGTGTEADHDGDGDPGATIIKSDQKLTTADSDKFQHWNLDASTSPLVLDGPVRLELWSTTKNFQENKDVDYSAWLLDCAPGGSCTVILSTTDVHVDDWNQGLQTWTFRSINLGTANHTVPAGHTLRLRLMFNHHDVWIASSIARPSRVHITLG